MYRNGRSALRLLPIVVVGCVTAGTPSELRLPTPLAPDAAYSCALAVVDSLGYTLTGSDRASGFLRAQHVENTSTTDILAVTALQSNGATELHVTAETYGIITNGTKSGVRGMTNPSDEVMKDASSISLRCAGPPGSPDSSKHS